jgi:hypothetical protein
MIKRTRYFGLSTIPALTRSLLAVGVVVLAAACGKGPTDPDGTDNTIIEPPAVTAIELQNNTQYTLVNVFIKSCSADSWGEDRYDGALAPGQSATFPDLSSGCYDIYVETSDLLHYAWIPGQMVTTGSTTIVPVHN